MEVRMTLANDEMQFVKELYVEKIKRGQVVILNEEMWTKVEAAKPDWEKVVKIKREYAILKAGKDA